MSTDATTTEAAQPKRPPRLPPRWFIRTAWILHRALLRISRGRVGLREAAADRPGYLQLATVGRRTGKERRAIVAYAEDGPNLVTLAMNGWGEPAPAWWLNLETHPDARIDLPHESRPVRARVADKDERERLWAKLDSGPWGDLNGYAAKRSRETPVVILEPPDQG